MAERQRTPEVQPLQPHEAASHVLHILQSDSEKWQTIRAYFDERFDFFRRRDRVFPDAFLAWNILHITSGFAPYRNNYFNERNDHLEQQFMNAFSLRVEGNMPTLLNELGRLLFLTVVEEKITLEDAELTHNPPAENTEYEAYRDNPHWRLEKLHALKEMLKAQQFPR